MTDLPVTPFRSHRDPAPLPGPQAPRLHSSLIAEWAQLCATPAASIPLKAWIRVEDVLTGCTTIGGILDVIDAAPPAGADALLNALLRLYQSGHQLAGRVVLQAMLPKLMKMSERGTSFADLEERRHSLIAAFWAVLGKARPEGSKIAAGLALDALHHITTARPTHDLERLVDPDVFTRCLGPSRYESARTSYFDDPADLAGVDDTPDPDDAYSVLAWGVRAGVICTDDAHLLAEVYLGPLPARKHSSLGYGDVAAARAMSPAAIRKRCSRASRALAAAVRVDITNADETDLQLSVAS